MLLLLNCRLFADVNCIVFVQSFTYREGSKKKLLSGKSLFYLRDKPNGLKTLKWLETMCWEQH
jgi:hypothetical protein